MIQECTDCTVRRAVLLARARSQAEPVRMMVFPSSLSVQDVAARVQSTYTHKNMFGTPSGCENANVQSPVRVHSEYDDPGR